MNLLTIENLEIIMKIIVFGTGGITYIFGGWFPLVGTLLVFIFFDILTGIMKGFYDKSLRSRKMSQGMISKAGYFIVLAIANVLDVIVAGGMPVCKTSVCLFYIGLEGLSIVENLALMNVPLPRFIKKYLLVLKEKGDGGDPDKQIVVPAHEKEVTLEFKEVEKEKNQL